MKRTALLIIDVQKGLFTKKIPIYLAEEMLTNICQLTAQAHQKGVPVIYVQHTNSTLPENTDGWQLHPHLQPLESDLFIHKQRGSAFEETELHEILSSLGVHEIIVTGLVSHGCIKAACLDGAKLGYRVTLVSDGHSNFHTKPAKIIKETHEKLNEVGVILKATREIQFTDTST
jgi:aminoglycoside 6'-N-acetyltransferase